MKIRELSSELAKIMPTNIAFEWDNVGLLIGDGQDQVKKVLLTLDVTENAVKKAIEQGCNLIISHHPIIFGKLSSLNNPLHLKLIRANIDVISMHTNLDSIASGVNRILSERLNLKNLRFISSEGGNKVYWVKVFVPVSHSEILQQEIINAGGGLYEKYDSCMVSKEVRGSFVAKEGAKPHIGQIDKRQVVDEIELQFRVDKANLNQVITRIKSIHPYERPVYHFYEITDDNINYGSGMVGDLDREYSLDEFANHVKARLKAPFVKLWTAGLADKKIKRVSVCGGSGSFLIKRASAISDLIVTGDVTYHTMLDSPLPIVDAGHFFTENPVLDYLGELLKSFNIGYCLLSQEEHEIKNLSIK
jgi:dinuclear metal center YbgI/SA1388 family protein